MRKTLVSLATLAVGALGGYAASVAATPEPTTPAPVSVTTPATVLDCPAEDSCQADYGDGAWWLRTFDDHSDTPPGPWVRVSR